MKRKIVMSALAISALALPVGAAPAAANQSAPPLEVAPGEALAFDFGCTDGSVADGHLEVSEDTVYDPGSGYGLSQAVDCRDRGEPEGSVRRDFTIGWDYEFTVDLPNGEYHVTIISGDEIASNNTAVTVNGEDQGSLQPRNPGEYAEHSTDVMVEDGQLTLAMRDDGRLNGLVISQVVPPTGLEVAEISVDPPRVELAWDAMEGAESYTVYRSPAGAEDFSELTTTTEPSFADEDVETGFTYDYAVTQTTAAGAVSGFSEPIQAAVADSDVEPPSVPQNVELTEADETAISFQWSGSEDTDQYYVHRTLAPEGGWERIGTTADTEYTVEGASEHSWYYAVTAVNQGGVSDRSEHLSTPRTAKPIANGEVPEQCGVGAYNAEVELDGFTWSATNAGNEVYEGFSMHEAMQAAVNSLTPDRTEQESVVVRGSGVMPANVAVELPSHTAFENCGTIHISGNEAAFSYEEHIGAVAIRYAEDVSVPFLSVTGSPNFGVYLRTSQDVHFGNIDLQLSGGLGMRLDSRDDDSVREARNITIDDVYVSGTESHGVETYGVDGIEIGTVTAVETGHAGLLLNDTVNADIDSVIGENAAAGTGYATFRTANRNGMIDGAYPTNIRVGEVIADGGGRGIFCVSESGGIDIERVEITNTQNNAMLLENCHNITIATESGTVEGPGDIVISARDEFDNNTDLTLQNLTLRNSGIREAVCGENTVLRNLTLEDSELDTCAELEEIEEEAPEESGEDSEETSPDEAANGANGQDEGEAESAGPASDPTDPAQGADPDDQASTESTGSDNSEEEAAADEITAEASGETEASDGLAATGTQPWMLWLGLASILALALGLIGLRARAHRV